MLLTIVAVGCAVTAAVFLHLRAQMLRPELATWPESPRCVRWASFFLSLSLGTYVIAVLQGYRPTMGEVGILIPLAAYAFLLWVNLMRQRVRGDEGPSSAVVTDPVSAPPSR